MVAGRDVRLDLFRLLKRPQQLLGDRACIDLAARHHQGRVGDDIGGVERVAVRRRAVARVDIVDQALIERPGVHTALPVVDDLVAETKSLGLHVGDAGSTPCFTRGVERGFARRRDHPLDRTLQVLRTRRRILIRSQRDIDVGVGDLLDGRRRRGKSCHRQPQYGPQHRDRRRHIAPTKSLNDPHRVPVPACPSAPRADDHPRGPTTTDIAINRGPCCRLPNPTGAGRSFPSRCSWRDRAGSRGSRYGLPRP